MKNWRHCRRWLSHRAQDDGIRPELLYLASSSAKMGKTCGRIMAATLVNFSKYARR